MNWLSAHFLDILTAVIIAAGIACGYRRGIVRMIIFLAGFGVSAALAAFASSACCEYVYLNVVKPAVISAVEENISSAAAEYDPRSRIRELLERQNISLSEEQEELIFGENPDFTESEESVSDLLLTGEEFRGTLNSVFTEYCGKLTESLSGVLPGEITESAEKYLAERNISEREKIDFFRSSNASAAEIAETEIIRPVMLKTVKNVIFAAVFAAAMLAFTVISRIFGILRSIEAVRAPDSFLGGILGLVYGIMLTMALALVCGIFIQLSSDSGKFVNSGIISDTYFFKYAYAAALAAVSAFFK